MDFTHTDVTSLFFKSHPFVQGILLILIIFSAISWGIAINKWKIFKKCDEENRRFLKMFEEKLRLKKLHIESKVLHNSSLASAFVAVMDAFDHGTIFKNVQYRAENGEVKTGKKFNISIIERLIDTESNKKLSELEKSIPFLGTCATLSPFLGLLGTVWGVMRSFLDIGIQGSANIMVVAPGIAEALITTVVGLAVAIPAVFFHNHFVGKLKKMSNEMEENAAHLVSIFEEGSFVEKL